MFLKHLVSNLHAAKLVMMPKMKSAMMFQPEDHVSTKVAPRLASMPMKLLQHGGIFGSGCLMFLGHHTALECLVDHHEKDLDKAPPLMSWLAGCFGGALYASTATPLTNYMRGQPVSVAGLTKGMQYTLPRCVVQE